MVESWGTECSLDQTLGELQCPQSEKILGKNRYPRSKCFQVQPVTGLYLSGFLYFILLYCIVLYGVFYDSSKMIGNLPRSVELELVSPCL